MSLTSTTHLNFRGTAREALEHYATVFGGQLTVRTYADVGMPAEAPGAGKVVFGLLDDGHGFRVMAYDVPGHDDADGSAIAGSTSRQHGATLTDRTFFLSVRGGSLAEVETVWRGLAEGAEIVEPLAASAWSPGFGMLTDRFGVTWVIDVATAEA